jgi:uncharacterized protein YhfF
MKATEGKNYLWENLKIVKANSLINPGAFMEKTPEIEAFWQTFIATLPSSAFPTDDYQVWHFSDNEASANKLGELVKAGKKTATCSLLWSYEVEDQRLPRVGEYNVITTWNGTPLCIILTTEVEIRGFNKVDAIFAYEEGEGDRSLDYWRKVHWEVFSNECNMIGYRSVPGMPLVCERFRKVYP